MLGGAMLTIIMAESAAAGAWALSPWGPQHGGRVQQQWKQKKYDPARPRMSIASAIVAAEVAAAAVVAQWE